MAVQRIYRIRAICDLTGMSRSSIYRLMQLGEFPKPKKIGLAAVGWPSDVIENWLASREAAGGA